MNDDSSVLQPKSIQGLKSLGSGRASVSVS